MAMEGREVLDCIGMRHDDTGRWVELDNLTGVVDRNAAGWKPEDVPAPGSRVKGDIQDQVPTFP